MSSIAALTGAAAVLAIAAATSQTRRWTAAQRARHRLRTRTPPGAPGPAIPVPDLVRAWFERAGLGADAERLVALWCLAVLAGTVLAVAAPSGRILLAVATVGPPIALQLLAGRAERQRAAQLPDALDGVAAGLRGGLALPAAVAGAASVGPPLGPELAAVANEVQGGRPLTEALARWQAGSTDAHTALAGAALSVAAQVGGPGARAVDGAASSLRDRLGNEAETSALATQARASAAVLTVAPIAFAFLLASLDPAAGRFLLGTSVGWLCIVAGLGLDALGAWWMSRLVRRAR